MKLILKDRTIERVKEINIGIVNVDIKFFDNAPEYILPKYNKQQFIDSFVGLVLEENEKGFINQSNQVNNFFEIIKNRNVLSFKGLNDIIYDIRNMINVGIWSMVFDAYPKPVNRKLKQKKKKPLV